MPRDGGARRQQILQSLALILEREPGTRVTTARLASATGVSEAALYRHFPSKARMFEGLIEFAEDTVFGLFRRVLDEQRSAPLRCEHMLRVLLGFAARNPGIVRVLAGDALLGEHERLGARSLQFFDRCETQLRQVLREHEALPGQCLTMPVPAAANLLMAVVEGRLAQFCRSRFSRAPLEAFDDQWCALERTLFTVPEGPGA